MLVTENSRLVAIVVLTERQQVCTIDSDYMLRIWDLKSGECESNIILKKEKGMGEKTSKLDYVCWNPELPNQIAIADEDGFVTIHNIYSGSVLFKMSNEHNLCEINALKFCGPNSTNLYLTATACSGDVLFYTRPVPQSMMKGNMKGSSMEQYVSQTHVKKNVHSGDLYAICCNE